MLYSIYQKSIASVSNSESSESEIHPAECDLSGSVQSSLTQEQVNVLLGYFPGRDKRMPNGLSPNHFDEWYFK